MTDPLPEGVVGQQAWTTGPQLTGLKPTLEKIRTLLGGRLDVQDGVALETADNTLKLQLRLVGNVIQITFQEPKPNVDLRYIIRLQRPVDGIRIFEDKLEVDIPGLPNPTFDIVS